MKTVYKAEKNCKVKINGVFYSGDKVIPADVGEEEIKRLLATRFIRKINLDDSGADAEPEKGSGANTGNETGAGNNGEKTLDQMSKKELKAEAERLGVKVDPSDSEEKIRLKVKEAQEAGA